MRFRLRYLTHDLELSPGTFVVGRSAECQLSLDDPLVSRRHALILVGDDEVFVEDAGSRNGVSVNGVKIPGRTRIVAGDKITIGTQEMLLAGFAEAEPARKALSRTVQGPVTMVSMPVAAKASVKATEPPSQPGSGRSRMEVMPVEEPTIDRPRRGEALKLLGGVAEKALALGNPEGAERLLANGLQEILADVRTGKPPEPEAVELAARFAARLAAGTAKGSWGDYAVQLFSLRGLLPPATVVDELYIAARKMRGFDLTAFRSYIADLRERSDLSPNEKFVLQRLDGLERLVASR